MPREYQFPFELRHLVYFREVARQLHFRKAAETLAIAQPALSRAIAQLEAALGADLLNRTRRGVEVTPAGRLLLERSSRCSRGLAAIPNGFIALAGGQVGHVRVAFTGLAMATVLPGFCANSSNVIPVSASNSTSRPRPRSWPRFKSGDIACGFFHPDAATPGLRTRLLLRERNGVLLPSSHPLAGSGAPICGCAISPPRRSCFSADAQSRFLRSDPRRIHQRGNHAANRRGNLAAGQRLGLVRAGLGATFMTPSEAQHLPPEVRSA